jgi:hypothetical protein
MKYLVELGLIDYLQTLTIGAPAILSWP